MSRLIMFEAACSDDINFICYRQKTFQEESCVEAVVQFSNIHHKDDVPPLGGKLVSQDPLALVNKQSIIITVIPSRGWTVRKNKTQQVT